MIKGLFSFRLTYSLVWGVILSFLPIFAGVCLGLSPALTGLLLAVNILLMSALQLYAGRVADRLNRRTLVIFGHIITIGYLSLIPLTHNFWQLLGLCALSSIGSAASLPAASALIIEQGRKFGMGSTMAIFFVAMSIGMIIGPILGGVILDTVNISSVFYFAAGMVLMGTILFIVFTKRHLSES